MDSRPPFPYGEGLFIFFGLGGCMCAADCGIIIPDDFRRVAGGSSRDG